MAETFRFRQLYPLSVVVSNIFFIFTPKKFGEDGTQFASYFSILGLKLETTKQAATKLWPTASPCTFGTKVLVACVSLSTALGGFLQAALEEDGRELGKPWKCWDQRLGSIDVSGGYNLPNILTSYLLGEITH